jgi:hypothetical protein
MAGDANAVERLYLALIGGDAGAAAPLIADEAFIAVPGHEGSGPEHFASLAAALQRDGFATWNAESYDVLVSEHHGVILDRWLDKTRGLDEHITMLAADLQTDGRFGIVSVYGYDGTKVGAFFDEGVAS